MSIIIETIIFCGWQNISLRGFRDFGLLDFKNSIKNDGNSRVLLRLRVQSEDTSIKKKCLHYHLMQQSENPKWNYWLLCNNIIDNLIVSNINVSGIFSILADKQLIFYVNCNSLYVFYM